METFETFMAIKKVTQCTAKGIYCNELSQYSCKTPNKDYEMKMKIVFELCFHRPLENYRLAFRNRKNAKIPKNRLGTMMATSGSNPACSARVLKIRMPLLLQL